MGGGGGVYPVDVEVLVDVHVADAEEEVAAAVEQGHVSRRRGAFQTQDAAALLPRRSQQQHQQQQPVSNCIVRVQWRYRRRLHTDASLNVDTFHWILSGVYSIFSGIDSALTRSDNKNSNKTHPFLWQSILMTFNLYKRPLLA